jgi:serine/threonine protein kinase
VESLRAGDPAELGGYRLLGRLGAGEMGEVFLGRHPTESLAAVKLVRTRYAVDAGFRFGLVREVALARKLRLPCVAAVLDADVVARAPWLASEYVAGPTLRQVVQRCGPLPESVAWVLAVRLAEALASLHAAGAVHGDLKPSNIMLAADGLRLTDVGVGRAVDSATETVSPGVGSDTGYLAPEQALGQETGSASDVFAFASVMVYTVTGAGPFGATSNSVLMLRRITLAQPDLSRVPHALGRELQACLVRQPAVRPTSASLPERLLSHMDTALPETWPSGYHELWLKSF